MEKKKNKAAATAADRSHSAAGSAKDRVGRYSDVSSKRNAVVVKTYIYFYCFRMSALFLSNLPDKVNPGAGDYFNPHFVENEQ